MEQDKINAYLTLYTALVTVSKAAAPMIPFMTEDIYQNLVRKVDASAPESIHLCDFPIVDESQIDKELEKLLCYTLEKDYIDISDVNAITTEQTENKIFDMIDAVALHQQKKALDLYYDLLALKEAPMRILFLLSSQFQRLMIVKSMTNQGFGNKEIALKAGCPEWAVRKYQSQSRAFSMDQLKQAIRDGVEYETAVKTGHMNDQMAVELFLVQYSAGK